MKYVTDEQALLADARASRRGEKDYLTNDGAREYVKGHIELRNTIVGALVWMHKARYEFELSNILGEDGCEDDETHFDRSFDHAMRAAKVRDQAVAILDNATDIDRATYEWLRFVYLYDLATV
jgi:hypothetical protein